jgi:hypothetical protein
VAVVVTWYLLIVLDVAVVVTWYLLIVLAVALVDFGEAPADTEAATCNTSVSACMESIIIKCTFPRGIIVTR